LKGAAEHLAQAAICGNQRPTHLVDDALDLFEVSIVRNPSHPKARILSAKESNSAAAIAEAIHRATAQIRKGK